MHVAIIGGGISGIAAAFYLAQQKVSIDIFESENQIGGRAGSDILVARILVAIICFFANSPEHTEILHLSILV